MRTPVAHLHLASSCSQQGHAGTIPCATCFVYEEVPVSLLPCIQVCASTLRPSSLASMAVIAKAQSQLAFTSEDMKSPTAVFRTAVDSMAHKEDVIIMASTPSRVTSSAADLGLKMTSAASLVSRNTGGERQQQQQEQHSTTAWLANVENVIAEYTTKGILGGIIRGFDRRFDPPRRTTTINLSTTYRLTQCGQGVESYINDPAHPSRFAVDASGGYCKRPQGSADQPWHLNCIAMDGPSGFDPTIAFKDRPGPLAVVYSLTNELRSCGAVQAKQFVDQQYLAIFNSVLRHPIPLMALDHDLTFMKVFIHRKYGGSMTEYTADVWKRTGDVFLVNEAHLESVAKIAGGDTSAELVLCPLPGRNVDPNNPRRSIPLLFSDETQLNYCGFHSMSDQRSWFVSNRKMKQLPLRTRNLFKGLMVQLQRILQYSKELYGIEKFPLLIRILELFEGLLSLPAKLTVPSVMLEGHLKLSFYT
jgi:hypothetical protein